MRCVRENRDIEQEDGLNIVGTGMTRRSTRRNYRGKRQVSQSKAGAWHGQGSRDKISFS